MILNEPFNKESLNTFLKDFLPDYQLDERSVRTPDKSILTEVTQLGASRKAEVTVLEAECEETDTNRRIAITQAAFKVLRDHSIRNAIIAFHDGTDQWRLSLLTSTLEIKDGKVIKKDSNPRRYSYLLGVGAKTVTPYKYLVEKGRVEDIKQLQERFSVEVVNKQFYASVADLFTKLVGGERGATKYPGLLKINSVISQNVEHQEFAVRLIGRIIFSWFLKEKKSKAGVAIVPNELLSLDAVASNADYYHSILEPLFFELLNKRVENRHESLREAPFSTVPYLNGGLFSPQHGDFYNQNSFNGAGTPGLTHIPNEWFSELFTVLEQYNFTVDENTSYDVDLSIDPEMLGRIFENLLAEINPETGESARKSTGSFYTPREIVDYMVDSSILEFLKSKTGADEAKLKALISWGQADDDEHPLTDSEKQKVVNALAGLTILDPACGSGAFPIGILQKVVYILQQADPRAEIWLENQLKNITSPELKRDIQEKYESENYDWLRKYGVIRETIFGIDIQTIATEISKLRCFLTLIIEEEVDDEKPNRGVHALPNLDFKFVTANSLVSLPDSSTAAKGKGLNLFEDVSHIEQLKSIRSQYFGANADERTRLKDEFRLLQNDMLRSRIASGNSTSDLYNELSDWDPFSHTATSWFDSEWMFGVEGFDIVIGNPPYLFLSGKGSPVQKLIKSGNVRAANILKDLYDSYAKQYPGSSRGCRDLYKWFVDASFKFTSPGGVVSLITPNTYITLKNYSDIRNILLVKNNTRQLLDLGFEIFDAPIVPSAIFIAMKEPPAENKVFYYDLKDVNRSELFEKSLHWLMDETVRVVHSEAGELSLYKHPIAEKIYANFKTTLEDYLSISEGEHNMSVEINELVDGPKEGYFPVIVDSELARNRPARMAYLPERYCPLFNKKLHSGDRLFIRKTGDTLFTAPAPSTDLAVAHQNVYVSHSKDDSISGTTMSLVLNSKIMTFLYQNGLYGQKGRTMAQFRIYALYLLPLPNKESFTREQNINSENVDEIMYKLYNLTPEEIAIVEGS